MRIFHTIQDVIEVAQQHAPTNACQRVMEEQGRIAVYKNVQSPTGLPGWIVEVIGGNYLRAWWIGVWLDAKQQRIRITYPDSLPAAAVEVKGPRL